MYLVDSSNYLLNSKDARLSKSPEKKLSTYTMSGILVGFCFPILSWTLDIYLRGLPFSSESLWTIHQMNPMHWMIDCAPLLLGISFHILGQKNLQRETYLKTLQTELIEYKKPETVIVEKTAPLEVAQTSEEEAEENRKWIRRGERILIKCIYDSHDKDILYKKFISEMCLYINSPYASLYLTGHNNELELIARYTKPRRRTGDQVEESELMSAEPGSLLLLPLRYGGHSVGILELTSGKGFLGKEKDFVNAAVEMLIPLMATERATIQEA